MPHVPDPGGRSSATPLRKTGSQSSPLQKRRRPAHHPPIESGFRSIILFLTICTNQRRPVLATKKTAALITDAWEAANFWQVGRYVIMPDHIHLFCAPNTSPPQPLKKWVAFWRNDVTRKWPIRDQLPIWQREFWDRQLRQGESYAAKWEYVVNNPVRHALVVRAEDWPFQGELDVLMWHDR